MFIENIDAIETNASKIARMKMRWVLLPLIEMLIISGSWC
jgi:hypothetical protein